MKRVFKWIGLVLLVLIAGAGVFVGTEVLIYQHSVGRAYQVPLPAIARSPDPTVIERGAHLAASVAGCAGSDCHGKNLAGGTAKDAGPIGTIVAPNITPAGRAAEYSDGELARLILHGIKRDGHTLRFMPAQDICWLPDEDVAALISYVRSVPAVNRPSQELKMGVLAMVLDRYDAFVVDVARRIDHDKRLVAPPPGPTAQYGAFLARSCTGCHGEHFSGGRIPGAPASMPVPANLTQHESGIGKWQFADFQKTLDTGVRPDGRKLDPFMPYEALAQLNFPEKQALWAFLQSLPPTPHGQR